MTRVLVAGLLLVSGLGCRSATGGSPDARDAAVTGDRTGVVGEDAGETSDAHADSRPAEADAHADAHANDAAAATDARADAADATDGAPRPFAWSEGTPCPLARFEANGVVIGGELWVLGGFTSATLQVTRRVDRYDPASDSWRAGPDLPGAETHFATVAVGSDIIVVGGFTGNFSSAARPPTTDAVWRWSAANAAWSAGPPLPSPGAAFAWALLGGELHLAGGLGPDGNTDTHTHVVWNLAGAGPWTTGAPLPDARNHGGGAASGGRFYAIAGRHQWDETAGDVATVNQFDPATGAWTNRAPIPIARSEIAASTSVMSDGRILVVGGSVAGVMPNGDVLIYDPIGDAWSALPSLPARRKGAVAARIGPRLIVTTGSPTSVDPSPTTFVGCCL